MLQFIGEKDESHFIMILFDDVIELLIHQVKLFLDEINVKHVLNGSHSDDENRNNQMNVIAKK
jgi:hypothetical protein